MSGGLLVPLCTYCIAPPNGCKHYSPVGRRIDPEALAGKGLPSGRFLGNSSAKRGLFDLGPTVENSPHRKPFAGKELPRIGNPRLGPKSGVSRKSLLGQGFRGGVEGVLPAVRSTDALSTDLPGREQFLALGADTSL